MQRFRWLDLFSFVGKQHFFSCLFHLIRDIHVFIIIIAICNLLCLPFTESNHIVLGCKTMLSFFWNTNPIYTCRYRYMIGFPNNRWCRSVCRKTEWKYVLEHLIRISLLAWGCYNFFTIDQTYHYWVSYQKELTFWYQITLKSHRGLYVWQERMREVQLGSHTVRSHGITVAKMHMHDWWILMLLGLIWIILNKIHPFYRFVGKDMMTDLKYPLKSNTVPVWAVPVSFSYVLMIWMTP